jgi:hypothetical protein
MICHFVSNTSNPKLRTMEEILQTSQCGEYTYLKPYLKNQNIILDYAKSAT